MILSHSQIATYQRCPREHHYRYILRRRPRVEAHALRFGKLFDQALQAWWLAGPMFARDAALAKLYELGRVEGTDPFDVAKARALLLGYDVRWANQPLEVLRVQPQFRTPIRNPMGQPSTRFEIQGFLDAIVRDLRTREIVIVEGKTTSLEINPESSYWRTITTLDPQISTYFDGARAILAEMGIRQEPARAIYDVVRKPALKPLKATPEESRRYKKNSNELYANQRITDETPEEYEGRVLEEIFGQPMGTIPLTVDVERGLESSRRYYARGDVVRLERDEIEHAEDVWQTAQIMRENLSIGRAPRYRGACKRYGGFCPYFAVCLGLTSIETFPMAQEEAKEEALKEL